MIIAIPIDQVGEESPGVGQTWGRASAVAVAEVREAAVVSWSETAVAWDVSHDQGSHGSHHARVIGFLRDNGVEVVAAPHVGPGMVRMLDSAGIVLVGGVGGDARAAVLAVAQLVESDAPA